MDAAASAHLRAGAVSQTTPAATTSAPQMTPLSLGLTTGSYRLTITITRGDQTRSASANITLVLSHLHAVKVYPNPWRSDRHGSLRSIRFEGLTMGTTIKIFTLSGHELKTIRTDGPSVTWDLTNQSGDNVASGVYLYLITAAGEKTRGKIAVIQ
jgi:hypothetical protein